MTGKRSVSAAVMCLVLLLALFTSAAYISREVHHTCTGDNCPICHEIQICQQILNTTGTGNTGAAGGLCPALFFLALVSVYFCRTTAVTLISLKVKLSD